MAKRVKEAPTCCRALMALELLQTPVRRSTATALLLLRLQSLRASASSSPSSIKPDGELAQPPSGLHTLSTASNAYCCSPSPPSQFLISPFRSHPVLCPDLVTQILHTGQPSCWAVQGPHYVPFRGINRSRSLPRTPTMPSRPVGREDDCELIGIGKKFAVRREEHKASEDDGIGVDSCGSGDALASIPGVDSNTDVSAAADGTVQVGLGADGLLRRGFVPVVETVSSKCGGPRSCIMANPVARSPVRVVVAAAHGWLRPTSKHL